MSDGIYEYPPPELEAMEQFPEPQEAVRWNKLRAVAMATIMVVSGSVMAYFAVDTVEDTRDSTPAAGAPAVIPVPSLEHLPVANGNCPPVSTASIHFVEQQLAEPPDSSMAALNKRIAAGTKDNQAFSERNVRQRELAASLGLHLFDYRKLFSAPDKNKPVDSYSPPTFADTVASTRKFLDNYGIQLEVGAPGKTYDSDMQAVGMRPQEITNHAAESAQYIFNSMTRIPKEFTDHVGLRKIVLLGIHATGEIGFEDNKKKTGYAGFVDSDKPGVIFLDPNGMGDDTFDHELEHISDGNSCNYNFIDTDNQFTALNPASSIYSQDKHPVRGYHGRSTDKHHHYSERSVVTTSEYGLTNQAEDKAEIGKFILTTAYDDVLERDSPILRNKFIFLLARLHQEVPALERYFVETASHPNTTTTKAKPFVPGPVLTAANPKPVWSGQK